MRHLIALALGAFSVACTVVAGAFTVVGVVGFVIGWPDSILHPLRDATFMALVYCFCLMWLAERVEGRGA